MSTSDCSDLYSRPIQYDIEYEDIKDDVPYYLARLGPVPGPILEIACGTGRVTLELAKQGYEMVGLDISADMLSVAQAKASDAGDEVASVEWIEADCRDFSLNRAFPRIILPFNSLCHLHDWKSVEACFRRVVAHLAPGGRFIFDLANPPYELLTCEHQVFTPVMEYADPDGRGVVLIKENAIHDEPEQVKRITWTYHIKDELIRTAYLNMRLFYPKEIEALLEHSGLKVVEKVGNYAGAAFIDGSPRQLFVCEAL